MTLTLDVPTDLQHELEIEAAELGLPLEEYAVRVLAGARFVLPPGQMPKTGADLVEYWERVGVIGSRPDITDPVAYARAMRSAAERRSRD
ncbi:MAG TPA: hypothetical protein VF541_21885 [Longimicrobium sp.]